MYLRKQQQSEVVIADNYVLRDQSRWRGPPVLAKAFLFLLSVQGRRRLSDGPDERNQKAPRIWIIPVQGYTNWCN